MKSNAKHAANYRAREAAKVTVMKAALREIEQTLSTRPSALASQLRAVALRGLGEEQG